jgi:hypothetical protein
MRYFKKRIISINGRFPPILEGTQRIMINIQNSPKNPSPIEYN